MSDFCAVVCGVTLFALPVLLVILIIRAIMRKTVKKIAWGLLGCFVTMIVSAVIGTFTDPQLKCEHKYEVVEYIDAVCDKEGIKEEHCSKCGKVNKETISPLNHVWKDADCHSPKTCQLCGITEGEKSEHVWENATCIAPKTCQLCGMTEGNKGEHAWKKATCITPKTCSICLMTDGESLSADKVHTWADATCVAPRTCTVCAEVEGSRLSHKAGAWIIVEEGTCEIQGTRQQLCDMCHEVISTEFFDSEAKIVADIIKKVANGYAGSADTFEYVNASQDSCLMVTCAVYCKNSEQEVENILRDISMQILKLDFQTECMLAFADVEKGSNGECLAIGAVDKAGEVTVKSMSVNFKTIRNEWIVSQFSAWDGSHYVLKDLIKDNLNDEKSFKHIETSYIDVSTEDKMKQVNDVLISSGYSHRVEIGDLFIITKFSAKNAFNATIKSTAYGIVDYSSNKVILIDIE